MTSAHRCTHCHLPVWSLTAAWTGGLCLACRAHRRHVNPASALPGDASRWSEASRRSRSYAPGMAVSYKDEYYWCERCGAAAVFTAVAQRHAYEVEKRHWLQTRKHCNDCHRRARGGSPAA